MDKAADGNDLAEVLGFTAEDVAANRAGQLSSAQRDLLTRERAGARATVVRMGIMLAVTMVVVVGLSQLVLSIRQASSALREIVLGVDALVIVSLAWWFRSVYRRVSRTLDARVQRAEGLATTNTRTIKSSGNSTPAPRYEVTIGEHTFSVGSEKALAAFINGQRYTAYHIGGTRLLSAEPGQPTA